MFNENQEAESTVTDYNSPFDRVESAEGRGGGIYPVPGVYNCLFVDTIKMIRSRKGDDLFVAEFDIIESTVAERPRGSRMSWIANFRHDATPGNVKAFLAATMGIPQDKVDAAGCKFACSDKNPCRGRLVRLEASNTVTKSGNDFTLCQWRPIPKEIQEQNDQLRLEAGFAPF